MSNSSNRFKVLAFDPGLTTTGWSLSEGSLENRDLTVLKMDSIYPGPTIDKKAYRNEVAKFDRRTITLVYLREQVVKLLDELNPDFVVAEDIFINMQRPQAYGALCMWISTVRMICRDHKGMYLTTIPTKLCKRETCGTGSSNKLTVQQAIAASPHIKFKDEYAISHMTEHQADSIAVAVAFRNLFEDTIKNTLFPPPPEEEKKTKKKEKKDASN